MRIGLWILTLLLMSCATKVTPVDVQLAPAETDSPMANAAADSAILALGRAASVEFYAGQAEALHTRFSPAMSAALPADVWAGVPAQLGEELGGEIAIVEESTSKQLQNRFYRRSARFEKTGEIVLVMTWVFDPAGTITGFTIAPPTKPAATPHAEYRTKTPLRVPFDGEWTVIWGGRTVEQNYHAATVSQRFALDLVVTDEHDSSHLGDGARNVDYYAFGKDVIAPGAGTVVAVVNEVPDNVPGQMNPAHLAGNYVLIDHGNGEFSLLAHMQLGSVTVGVGAAVEPGDVVGKCGNSGNTSEPHIHYHLQNVAEPLGGEGLPIFFDSAVIDGTNRRTVELEQGQRIHAD